ncbi:hypothetical protein ACFQE1_05190 [Halobium palmae]|uniref:Uncharacterized protein n=1 Tax=Halobium palmae TaxID=1776492 RepID=A0ABD5RX21_9EURY
MSAAAHGNNSKFFALVLRAAESDESLEDLYGDMDKSEVSATAEEILDDLWDEYDEYQEKLKEERKQRGR